MEGVQLTTRHDILRGWEGLIYSSFFRKWALEQPGGVSSWGDIIKWGTAVIACQLLRLSWARRNSYEQHARPDRLISPAKSATLN